MPYHPKGNGLIERWNQTLKNMLHHIIREEGKSWQGIYRFYYGLIGKFHKCIYWYTTFSINIWKKSVVYIEVSLEWEHVVTSEYEGISRELFEKVKRKVRSSNPQGKVNK
ncbi:hypothetical protein TNIN_94321 [Trichonephila inaurata madagascariensis]|uniref:Integrase catalytic domain-containing protein n=1 Tax=Trichonephila inaurata madagascariensis TaxID=2747483 RepID=A0A8X7CAX6_9ARAC|nr:hypothetical protein TNIN_94321 [Trichonephila inaurata madagascariensis]